MMLDLFLVTRSGMTKLLPSMPSAPPEFYFPLVGTKFSNRPLLRFRRYADPIESSGERLVLLYEEV